MKKIILLLSLLMAMSAGWAQTRDKTLTIAVTTDTGDNLEGQPLTLVQTDYSLSYGALVLDAAGTCTVKVYAGSHRLTVERLGYAVATTDFTVAEDAATASVQLHLTEQVQMPFAFTAVPQHDALTGKNHVRLTWNTEPPAFFDDFETYEPFAIQFGEWTGIDADLEAAAAIEGEYPNRCVMQYAQIINPLAVSPPWWYDYPILRPYSGKQYVGFTRTSSGNANDDWLISPAITVGKEHVLMFLGKAADKYDERFQVYVTTKTDQPTQADFTRIDEGNYETADYKGWRIFQYDLGAYTGKEVKFAIRYISHYNRNGSFMLMIDDVYVGQAKDYENTIAKTKARRAPARSASNPNEYFHVYLDGNEVGVTEEYEYVVEDVPEGTHTLGVKATYLAAESEMATATVVIDNAFAPITFHVSAESLLSADGQVVNMVDLATSDTYEATVKDGVAVIPSLPHGDYVARIEEGAFNAWQQTVSLPAQQEVDVLLTDRVMTPYNITADVDEGQTVVVKWNRELLFCDSFEDYDDFATGEFGGWKTVDRDKMPVYPIALGDINNVVFFPGAGTANSPQSIAPMVFNPWSTTPPMMPTDPAVAAPTGDKTVIFFSPQRAAADKWLISPAIDIYEGYTMRATLKSYDGMYPETAEFCVATVGDQPEDFMTIATADDIAAEQWTIYEADLADYVGQRVRLALHYISYDAFFLQLDDFTVGSVDGETPFIDYGNVVRYDIYVDGVKIGESTTPTYTLTGLGLGSHTVGIVAVYQNAVSEMATVTVNVSTDMIPVTLQSAEPAADVYTLSGQKVRQQLNQLPKGIYIIRSGQQYTKTYKK